MLPGDAGQPAALAGSLGLGSERLGEQPGDRPGDEPAQRADREPGPVLAHGVDDRGCLVGLEEVGLLGDDGGAALVELTLSHGVHQRRGAGELVEGVGDPVGRDVHRHTQAGSRELGCVEALVAQPPVDLGLGAVLLPRRLERGQVRQRDGLPGRRGVLVTLGLLDDVEELLGGEGSSGLQQHGIPALTGDCGGTGAHAPVILERLFEYQSSTGSIRFCRKRTHTLGTGARLTTGGSG